MQIKVKILSNLLKNLPAYGSPGSAGLDLCACVNKKVELNPNTVELVPTGIAIFLEDENFAVLPGDAYAIGFIRTYANHLGLNSDLSVLDDGRFVGVAPLFTKASNDKVTPFKFGSSFSNDGRFLPEGVNVGYTAKNLKAETASLRIFNCYLVPDVVVEKPQPSEQPSEEKFAFKPVSVDFTPLSIEFYRLFENDEFMNFKGEIKDSEGQQFGKGKLNIGLMFDFRNLKKKQKILTLFILMKNYLNI